MTPHRARKSWIGPGRAVIAVIGAAIPLLMGAPARADTPPTTSTTTPTTSTTTPTTSTTTPTTSTTTPGAGLPVAGAQAIAGSAIAQVSGPQPMTGVGIVGSGSSFAGPEVLQWTSDTTKPPYSLNVDYTPTSSGDGRFNFGNGTVDFAVSDIPYQSKVFDTAQPTFPFMYVPVTAGGLAFMYHLNGMPAGKTLQLSSYSACAIFTGAIATWNNKIIQDDNPGVALPDTAIHPVIRSDLAGTNFVFQEYCIHEQPQLWADFVDSPTTIKFPNQVGDLSATEPRSDWPLFQTAIPESGSAAAADTVALANNDGYITAVETAYAIQRDFPVASVKNASGMYTQPSALDVASALAYATQNADGTHNLNFDGAGPHVYNPSTYSYLLTPTTGWNAQKGAVMSAFASYALTIGQQKATEIGYASLGLSLEQYGVNSIKQYVPGAVALTSDEQGAYACGDFTPAEVQAGATSPTCGVTNSNNSSTPSTAAGSKGATSTTSGSKPSTRSSSGSKAGGGSGSGGTGGSSVDPGVSLSTSSPSLAFTGVSPIPVIVVGTVLLGVGWSVRRRLRARTR